MMQGLTNIAIFASGAGSNAKALIEYFMSNPQFMVCPRLIICNNNMAGVNNVAAQYRMPVLLIEKEQFSNGDAYITYLKDLKIEWLVLAGFLWQIPKKMVEAFPDHIINIHPALLPLHGGKGMYGMRVHEAVKACGDTQTGITIHLVDEQYDHGKHILQKTCAISPADEPKDIARNVQALEHEWFAKTVAATVTKMPFK